MTYSFWGGVLVGMVISFILYWLAVIILFLCACICPIHGKDCELNKESEGYDD